MIWDSRFKHLARVLASRAFIWVFGAGLIQDQMSNQDVLKACKYLWHKAERKITLRTPEEVFGLQICGKWIWERSAEVISLRWPNHSKIGPIFVDLFYRQTSAMVLLDYSHFGAHGSWIWFTLLLTIYMIFGNEMLVVSGLLDAVNL